MSYAESATNGNVLGMVRFAILDGALWAVGISWSTAIRAVTLQIVPGDSRDVVLGELTAASITTVLAVAASYAVMRNECCEWCRGACARRRRAPDDEDAAVAAASRAPRRAARV